MTIFLIRGGHGSISEYLRSSSVMLPSLIFQLPSGMCLECTFLMAPPAQRIMFQFLGLPPKAFPFLVHPTVQPHHGPSPHPAYQIPGKPQMPRFLKEVWTLCLRKTSTDSMGISPKLALTLTTVGTFLSLLCPHTSLYFKQHCFCNYYGPTVCRALEM